MASETSTESTSPSWQHALEAADEDAFRKLVEPHMETLLRAARHDLQYYVAQGYLHANDLAPEEVVGQTLIYAWEHRRHCPEEMDLREWLLSAQVRVVRTMVDRIRRYRDEKAISLDEPLPVDMASYREQAWTEGWQEPKAQIRWEDVLPNREPMDVEVSLLAGKEMLLGEPQTWHVMMMHDEFGLSLPAVSFALDRAVNEVAEVLEQARATYRERVAETPPIRESDEPMPPEELGQ